MNTLSIASTSTSPRRGLSRHVVGFLASIVALGALTSTSTAVVSESQSGFNGTSIAAGRWVWFSSNFKYNGPTDTEVSIWVTNVVLDVYDGNVLLYSLPAPDAVITMSPTATQASVVFDEFLDRWVSTIPSSFGDDIFFGGLAWQVPANLPGGLDVTWSADFAATVTPVQLKWKWGAAVYTTFTDDYDQLNVKPIHQSRHAGTPEAFTAHVVGGARGGGGSNFTGSWSGTKTVLVGETVGVESESWSGVKRTFR